MSKQTHFNVAWLTDKEFCDWVGKDSNNDTKARCLVCGGGSFSLGNMGKQALRSHAKGRKHKDKMMMVTKVKTEENSLSGFLKREEKEECGASSKDSEVRKEDMTVPPAPDIETDQQQAGQSNAPKKTVDKWVSKEQTLNAEMLWAMKTLMSNYSANSSQGNNELFAAMFPDSTIAKQFQCSKTKCSYIISHGIAPYYHDLLLKQLQAPGTKYVISFDESLNTSLQQEQMDILVRIWDVNSNRVSTRYYSSQFLGHTRASDLVDNFKTGIQDLRYSDLLQISMDGPSTNWKFFDEIVKDRELDDPNMPKLLNLGSCGLHVVHGSFKSGASATGWELDSLLRSMFYLFENSPARREDYERISGNAAFPLRFCSTRWLEDIPVAERAIEVWPSLVKYVTKVSSYPKSKVPTISSFQKLVVHSKDPLIRAKLQFFVTVAKMLQPFLKKFQTDKPMTPFLAEELYSLLKALLEKFIKPDVIEKATTMTKLANIEVMEADNIVHPKHVEIGFAALQMLKQAEKEKVVSERQVVSFKKECITFLQKTVLKLLDRCPLKYPVVRYLVSINPVHMTSSPESAKKNFNKLLQNLLECNVRDATTCDIVQQQYKNWVTEIQEKEEFSTYDSDKGKGLDELFYESIGCRPKYKELFGVVKDVLILSHGQSSVERGFSDNKDIMKDNMSAETVIAYRRAYDGIKSEGKPVHECSSKALLESCKHARFRYQAHQEESKKNAAKKQKDKDKAEISNQLEEAKKKVTLLRKSVDKLIKDADELAQEAEKKNKLSILVQSNAFREKSHTKRKELEDEMKNVDSLQKKLKLM